MQFQEIMLRIEQLRKQIEYVLNNYQIADNSVFSSFKLLEMRLMRLEKTVPGYDSSDTLLEFLYEICSGWNSIEGYQNYDPIAKMIESL